MTVAHTRARRRAPLACACSITVLWLSGCANVADDPTRVYSDVRRASAKVRTAIAKPGPATRTIAAKRPVARIAELRSRNSDPAAVRIAAPAPKAPPAVAVAPPPPPPVRQAVVAAPPVSIAPPNPTLPAVAAAPTPAPAPPAAVVVIPPAAPKAPEPTTVKVAEAAPVATARPIAEARRAPASEVKQGVTTSPAVAAPAIAEPKPVVVTPPSAATAAPTPTPQPQPQRQRQVASAGPNAAPLSETERLREGLARATFYMAASRLANARAVLVDLSRSGHPDVLQALAETYDPLHLRDAYPKLARTGDSAKALEFYDKAKAAGAANADARMRALKEFVATRQ